MRAARVKSKRGISRKHQPAREERETGYFISRPPRIEISLKPTLVLYYVIAVKLLTHFSGAGNTGRHTHTYLCGGRGLPIYYIMIIIVYYIYIVRCVYRYYPYIPRPIVDSRSLLQETSRSPASQYILLCTV